MIDKKFRENFHYYALQSIFATLAIFIVLIFLSIKHAVIIAAIGSTAFIVFAMPNNITAKPKRVVGGHTVGVICGFLGAFISLYSSIPPAISYSLAVGLSIFLMCITDTEHPPASGTALGIAVVGGSVYVGLFTILSAVMLSLAHRAFRPWLKDLI